MVVSTYLAAYGLTVVVHVADPRAPSSTGIPSERSTAASSEIRDEVEFDFAQAKRHFNEGSRLYQNGQYAQAAIEFERSYVARPNGNSLYNAALSYERAGKAVNAIDALTRYLELPPCPTTPSAGASTIDCALQRADAQQALQEQQRLVGAIDLKIPEGVRLREVRIAGQTIPLEDFPWLLSPGPVDVELIGMGSNDRRTRTAYITAGEVYEVYVAPFDYEDDRSASPTPNPTVDRLDSSVFNQNKRWLPRLFWTTASLTLASGTATAIVGGLTRYHFERYNEERCTSECYRVDPEGNLVFDNEGEPIPLNTGFPLDHRRLFLRYKPVTNALIGVTVGVAVGTSLIGLFAFRPRTAPPKKGAKRARTEVYPGAPGIVVRW